MNRYEARLIELETRIAFQDQALSDLNSALYQQQTQIDLLREKLDLLIEMNRKNRDEPTSSKELFEIPPHY
jgi:SlyX protein